MKRNLLLATLAISFTFMSTMAFAASPTVVDHGMSQKDTDLTRYVREQLVADSSLSMRAKNVTIITQNGQVTLRGPVANTKEKSKVEELAKKVSGTQAVINQTEVSANY